MSAGTLRAEPQLVELLGALDGSGTAITQQQADELLARIAWSRLAEPGDAAAGTLTSVLGAQRALDLLVREVTADALHAEVQSVAASAGVEFPVRVAAEALRRWIPRLQRRETVLDIERAVAAQLRVLLPGSAQWPVLLDDLGVHAPNMLWLRGAAPPLRALSLGVVGARAATGYGSHVTAELVDGACRAGLVIVSGAAYGIDAVAHRTALAAGVPTVAVLAGGVDRPYPRAHESLLQRISDTGVVCSEMVPGSAPTRWRFLQRNRLIAALSAATLVTEAGMRSGSLNTAGHASQLGRQLGAVPGPITSAASAGCHKLVREYGAILVTNASEVCELAGVGESDTLFAMADVADDADEASGAGAQTTAGREGAWARRVSDALPLRGCRDLLTIARLAGLSLEHTRGILAELELLGRVRRHEAAGQHEPQWGLVR